MMNKNVYDNHMNVWRRVTKAEAKEYFNRGYFVECIPQNKNPYAMFNPSVESLTLSDVTYPTFEESGKWAREYFGCKRLAYYIPVVELYFGEYPLTARGSVYDNTRYKTYDKTRYEKLRHGVGYIE